MRSRSGNIFSPDEGYPQRMTDGARFHIRRHRGEPCVAARKAFDAGRVPEAVVTAAVRTRAGDWRRSRTRKLVHRKRLAGADHGVAAPGAGVHRSIAVDEVLWRKRPASTWAERKRKKRSQIACLGGALAYPEAQRAVVGAGGGRSSSESRKLAAGPERGTAKMAGTEGTLRRFLARGEQGEGGASLGALGLER
jgi:hypothetical protein